jgi:hypothetical protein
MSPSTPRMAIAALRHSAKSLFSGSKVASPLGALVPGRPGAGSAGNQEKKRAVGGASPACFRREDGHACSSDG